MFTPVVESYETPVVAPALAGDTPPAASATRTSIPFGRRRVTADPTLTGLAYARRNVSTASTRR